MLSLSIIAWLICLDRLTTSSLTWLNGLDIVLGKIGFLGLFGFAYGVLLFSSSFWKFIFWGFMVRWAIAMWVCAFPEEWNTWNAGMFLVTEIIFVMARGPFYLALHRMAYEYGGSPSSVSGGGCIDASG